MVAESSPYSSSATATLKTDFPDYWEDIKAYGYANPQMVSWINEDPHLVCSLLNVGKVRWLVGTGSQHIDTGFRGFVHAEDAIEVKCKADAYPSSIAPLLGTRSGSEILLLWSANPNYYTSTGTDFQSSIDCKTVVVWKFDKQKVYYNGTLSVTSTERTTSVNTTLLFKGRSGSGGVEYRTTSSRFAYCKIWDNGVPAREMYPFIRKINGVDTCGMIDVLSGTFYKNAGSGSFTIFESSVS